MKNRSKAVTLVFLLILLTGTILLTANSPFASSKAQLCSKTDHKVYSMEFISAEYLDADNDGLSDDTRFFVKCHFSQDVFSGKTTKINCFFEIILPSGYTYEYEGFMLLNSYPIVIVQFDVYNTVSECGWYTINFYSTVQVKNSVYVCFCTTTFDPPTGHGEGGGTPTIEL